MDKTCRNCTKSHKRDQFSFKTYGNYQCGFECCLSENEKTPYRRLDDTCEKWEGKREQT